MILGTNGNALDLPQQKLEESDSGQSYLPLKNDFKKVEDFFLPIFREQYRDKGYRTPGYLSHLADF